MTKQRYGVGIVGLQPGRSWGAVAHVPALRALSDDYEIVGVANTSRASAEAAAAACGLPRAFTDVPELVASPDVDIVAVTVKVPHHFEIVRAAIEAGKHVYCEWPLGNGLAEAEKLADLARARGVFSVIGTQARVAPEIAYLREVIADGFVGEVLSTTLVGSGGTWGTEVERRNTYLLDRANGATMLTIPFGHTMAAVRDVLGEVVELSARLATRRTSVRVIETGETRTMTAPDQVLIEGVLASGAPISVHYRGGAPRGTGFLWEINGTKGDIQVTGANGHAQMVQLFVEGARGDDRELRPLDIPEAYTSGWPENVIPGNVARVYARMAADLRDGTRTAPSFDDAVALHRLIAAVEAAADNGGRVAPSTL
jgi:predicted dehydrogenase